MQVTQHRHDMDPDGVRQLLGCVDPTILEIGCNDGTDTNRFLATFPRARIYCFEPDPRAIRRFKQTVFSERVTLIEAAVSNEDGTAWFNGSSGQPSNQGPKSSHYCFLDEWDLSGSLSKPTGHLEFSPWVTFPEDRRIEVPVITLDGWLERYEKIELIDFIWMDVQGHELGVIRGAKRTLALLKYLYTEYADKPLYEGQACLQDLVAALPDFELVSVHGTGHIEHNALFRNTKLPR